jgi:hypothetical protein
MKGDARDLELTRIWNTDPPEDMAWICQEPGCDSWATIPGNAGFHAEKLNHALPVLGPIPPRPSEEIADTRASVPTYTSEDGRKFIYLCAYCFQPLYDSDDLCESPAHLASDGSGIGRPIRSIDIAL